MVIALAGFMGCGKSSAGKGLSMLLSSAFTDLDSYIEKKEGMGIPEIFSTFGEKYFRKKEKEALTEVLREASGPEDSRISVLSLGGGTLTDPDNRMTVRENTLCIYLKASPGTIASHLEESAGNRPLLRPFSGDRDALEEYVGSLMAEREQAYMDTAGIIIDTDGKSVSDTVSEILSHLKERKIV